MEKIAFFYRNDESLIAFAPLLAQLFAYWHLEKCLIQHVLAGNYIKAGEFALNYFQKSECSILIVEENRISIPEGVPHIVFSKTDDIASLFGKISKFEEKMTEMTQ
jgi:hypothetical protein